MNKVRQSSYPMAAEEREDLARELEQFGYRETDDPDEADRRNFYKVEKWSRDGERVTELLFAGSSLDKAKRVFDRWAKHRPRIRMTIRQRTRVLQQWPE